MLETKRDRLVGTTILVCFFFFMLSSGYIPADKSYSSQAERERSICCCCCHGIKVVSHFQVSVLLRSFFLLLHRRLCYSALLDKDQGRFTYATRVVRSWQSRVYIARIIVLSDCVLTGTRSVQKIFFPKKYSLDQIFLPSK